MRVIAGSLKGRKLKAVPGKQTRPTTDKVKESIFQIIGPFFDGGACLDLFAGSGSLGIEAMSRGMEQVVFIDKLTKAIHIIHENRKTMRIEAETDVFKMDAFRSLRMLAKNDQPFNLILIDPPYEKTDYKRLVDEILAHNLLSKGGIILCEHDLSHELPLLSHQLAIVKQANYGTTGITIYQKKQE